MTRSSFAFIALLVAAPVFAQNAGQGTPPRPPAPAPAQNAAAQNAAAQNQGQLRLIVIDQTSAGIPTATVMLTPPTGEPITVMTDERGVVTVPTLAVGTFKIHIEFSGFDTFDGTLTIRRGANNQTITMNLAGLAQEVTVTSEEAGGDTKGAAMTTSLTQAEISALPDQQEDLQAFLEELAGPGGATFFLNGFRGGRLPTKDEIRSIRIRSNSFAADGHDSGGRTGIEIITRPSTGSYQGGMTFGYQGDKLSARNAQAMEETPEGTKQIQMQFRGPIIRNKTSFSLNVSGNNQYRSLSQIALDQSGHPLGTQVRMPTETRNVNGNIEHALTAGSTLRLAYQGTQSDSDNQGLTNFDYTERARQTESTGNMYRAQVQGLVGKNMLNEIRFEFNKRRNATTSYSNAPAIIVPEAFNSGGAGVNTNSLNRTFEVADNFDFTPIKNHQMRVGFLLEGGLYDFFDETNPNGRTTYASFPEYQIGRKLQFTQRTGVPINTSFNQYQAGFYVQDDIKVNNRLSLGVGLRNEMQTRIDDRLNLMPRIGFSLNPGGTRTSIRGGYGKYYDWYDASLHDQTLRLNGKTQIDTLTIFEYQADEFGNLIRDENGKLIEISTPVPPGVSNRTEAAPGLDLPYVHQFSLGVDRQLHQGLNLQVTYQRLNGRNQLRGIDVNTPVLDEATGIVARPDPTSLIVTQIQSTGKSQSDRLTFQTRFQLPAQRGMLNANYQLGQAKADFTGPTSLPSSSLNPELDWGPQGQDIRHQFQFGGMVRLPWQLRLQSQLRVRSSPAFNFTTGNDNNRDGVINDRPENVTRNSLRGDSTWDITQVSLNKTFGFGGPRDGGGNPTPQGGRGGNAGPQGGGNFPAGGQGGNFQGGQGGGNFQGGGGGGGFQGGQGGGNFRGNTNSRYSVEFTVQATNPLNRVIHQNYTGNLRSPYFHTATGVAPARRVSFNTSFRF